MTLKFLDKNGKHSENENCSYIRASGMLTPDGRSAIGEAIMDWIDCPLIEQIPGKLSGAPVLRGSRVRPTDLLLNVDMGAEWLADAHFLPVEQVREVLAFYEANRASLPTEYVSPARRRAMSRASAI